MNWQKIYERTLDWVIVFGPRLVLAVLLLTVGVWFIRLIKKWFANFLSHRKLDPSLRPFMQGTVGALLQVLLVLALLQIVGIQMTMFAALIGAFGVAAGLALSGTLQNFASGILILLLKPFKVGDNILSQSQEGTVTSIQLFYTIVVTYDNKSVIIPNGKLSNEVIINLSREGNRRMDIELEFGYDVPFEKVKAVIQKSIDDAEDFLKDPPSRIGISSMEPDGYKVAINIWVNAHGFADVKMAYQEKLIERFRAEEVKLPGMK